MAARRLKQPDYKMERKTLPVFVVNKDMQLRQVEAIVSVFGVRDLVDDIIYPGAYTKTIVERAGQIRVLDNHRTDSTMAAIGRPLQIKEIKRDELPEEMLAKFPDATGGLWTLTQFDDTPEGQGVFDRIVSGTINEWSIGFDVLSWDKSTVTNEDGKKIIVRNIREIRLWEYSAVLWGANQATWTVDAKGAPNIESEPNVSNPITRKSQDDAPDYRAAPDGYNRCETCYFFDPDGRCRKFDFNADKDSICDDFKAGSGGKGKNPTEGKQVEGIEESLGATLIYRVYDSYITIVNYWLAISDISIDEHRQLIITGGELVDFIQGAVPADILQREEEDDPFSSMMFWAADGANQIKRLASREGKTGRVLSKANATKLVSAVDTINGVLTDAGIIEQAQESDDSEGKGSQPTQTQAGSSEVTPTLSEDDQIKSVKAAREAIANLKKEGVK